MNDTYPSNVGVSMIGEHLRKHPEKKENALADDDLLAVRSYIEDLLK